MRTAKPKRKPKPTMRSVLAEMLGVTTIGLAIDECIQKTKHDFRTIEARTGLFVLYV